MTIFEKWFSHNTKLISLKFKPKMIRHLFKFHTNGAKKGIDKCLDLQICILGFCINYINSRYDKVNK